MPGNCEPRTAIPITGLAIDDASNRVYLADDAGVKVVSLKTFKLTDLCIPLERAGKLEVDAAGNLWAAGSQARWTVRDFQMTPAPTDTRLSMACGDGTERSF